MPQPKVAGDVMVADAVGVWQSQAPATILPANVALRDAVNQFAAPQRFDDWATLGGGTKESIILFKNPTNAVVDQQKWHIRNLGQDGTLRFIPINDAENNYQGLGILLLRDSTIQTGGGIREHGRGTPMGEWLTYSVTLTPNVGTLTGGTIEAAYMIVGKTMFVKLAVSAATLSVACGTVEVSLPFSVTPLGGVSAGVCNTHDGTVWGPCMWYHNVVGASLTLYGYNGFAIGTRYFWGQMMVVLT